MGVQEDAFAKLAIIRLVDVDVDLTASIRRMNGAIKTFRVIDRLGQWRLTKLPHLTVFVGAYLPLSGLWQ
jgi:hypothetical protein